jgi:glycosyltransferase involved in cell wall biosynthesis
MAAKLTWAATLVPALRRFLRQHPPDVVLTFLWLPTLLCALALRGLQRKPRLVWSVQSDLETDFATRWLGSLRAALVKCFVPPQVAHYIAISRGVAEKTARVLAAPQERITVIPNAIDLSTIEQLKSEPVAGIPPKAPGRLRLISVGRLAPQKAHHDLIAAFALAAKKAPQDLELVILGEGPERQRLEALREELGLTDQILLPGAVANPYAWLAQADIFALASHWEPFGIVITEALAVGLPVISTATDGGRDILEGTRAGILVPAGDVAALAQAIADLVSNAPKRAALSRVARSLAAQFDVSSVVPRYEAVLTQVMQP